MVFVCDITWEVLLLFHLSVPLGRILVDGWTYSYNSRSKKRMVFYCNTDWPMYVLESEERWPLNGIWNYHTIIIVGVLLSKGWVRDFIHTGISAIAEQGWCTTSSQLMM